MARDTLGKIPKFTDEETPPEELGTEEVKETPTEEVEEEEKETPSELPAEEKPAEEESPSDDTGELLQAVESLQTEKEKLLREIQELRGQRREIKKEELVRVDEKLDELKDLYPEDISVIDRILKAKGYVTKGEAQKMFYEQVKQEELTKFLEKYPEYKPENDPNDINWNALQRELGVYRMPENPHLVEGILYRAHKAVQKVPSERGIPAKKRQVEIAGVGAGGTQRSSSLKTLPAQKRQALEQGGWSEEEIREIESSIE